MTSYFSRRAEPRDASEIANLVQAMKHDERLSSQTSFTAEDANAAFFAKESVVFAAVAEAELSRGLIGLVLWSWTYDIEASGRGGFISNLYVAPEFRLGGVGAGLCAAVAREVKIRGGSYVWWVRPPADQRYSGFYARLGATEDKVSQQTVFGPAFDALAARPTETGDG